ncbi:phage tail sheath subtilisin-like domain-containing protein [Sphingomonas sp. LT1P40]|uniref:phage tail sheath subtilisin-like domain-containing protein n=1 Tax=Alteristakelama amylovorans TaxID=3096166 RepID=UPI002FC6719F
MTYQHGISVIEVAGAARSLATIATLTIGFVATGPAADAAAFPLNVPVKIQASGILAAIDKAGATGTLRGVLLAISDLVRVPIVVVRVAPGGDAEETDENVIGGNTDGVKTGMQALLSAETQLGLKPRIIGAPGLDTQPVATALAVIATKLRGMGYARAIGDTIAELIAYRAGFTQRELMLIAPDFKVMDALGNVTTSFAAARALGLRARIDAEMGWHKTLSNVPVEGVVGTTEDIEFDFQSVDTEANQLNEAGITTIVRINGTLRFWGSRTCADPANDVTKDFQFESATRTAQIIADTIAYGMLWAIDKPLTPGLARDIVEQINEKFRQLSRGGFILGAESWFDPARNAIDDLKAGKLTISYKYTPVPPLENLQLRQEITDEYLADFAEIVAAAA